MKSNVLRFPSIIWTVIKHIPTLDPLVILTNAPIFIGIDQGKVVGFLSIKKFGKTVELGTLYVYPSFRKQGYAEQLFLEAKKQYPKSYLLCTPKMSELYMRYGFQIVEQPKGIMGLRKRLFDKFIAPFVGYRIVVMETK